MTLVYGAVLILLPLWVIQQSGAQVCVIRITPLDFPIVVFLMAAALSSFLSIDPSMSWHGAYRIYVFGFFPMTAFALLFWLSAQGSWPGFEEKILGVLLASGAAAGGYACLQYQGWEIFEKMPLVAGGEPWSSLGNPIYMGAVCMMAFLAGAALWIRPATILPKKIGIGLGLLLNLLGMTLSLSRSAWAGAAVGLLVLAWGTGRTRSRSLISVVGMIGSVMFVIMCTQPRVRTHLRERLSFHESSNIARWEGWKAGIHVWQSRPWVGTGPDTFFQAFRPYRSITYLRSAGSGLTQADAHNDVIQMLSTMGLLGALAFLWIFCRLFLSAEWARSSESAGLFACLSALAVQNQFNFSSVSTSAWAAVLAGVLMWPRRSEKSIVVPKPFRRVFACAISAASAVVLVYGVGRPLYADFIFQEARQLSAMGQTLRSLELHRQAVQQSVDRSFTIPNSPTAVATWRSWRPDGPMRQSLFDEAWSTAQGLTRAHPSDPDAWNNEGVAAMWITQLTGHNLMTEAHDAFETAVRLDPVFIDAWANLAKWEHLSGHLDTENVLWKKVLVLDPDHPMARQVLHLDQ